MLGLVRGEDQCLGARAHVVSVQDEVAQRLAQCSPAGLAGEDRRIPLLGKPLGQQVDLCRLAGPVAALEGDKQPDHTCCLITAMSLGDAADSGCTTPQRPATATYG